MLALDGHQSGQSAWLADYAERHRAGLRIGTAITESTANSLVNCRMSKSQQKHWQKFQPSSNLCPIMATAARPINL